MKTNKFHLIFFLLLSFPSSAAPSLLVVYCVHFCCASEMRSDDPESDDEEYEEREMKPKKECLCKQFTPSHSCSRLFCLTAADWGCSFLLCFCSFSPEKSPPIRQQQHCHPLFYQFLPQEKTLDSSRRISMHSQSRTLPHSSFAQHHIFICCSLYSDHNWISMNDEDASETSSMFLEGIACCCKMEKLKKYKILNRMSSQDNTEKGKKCLSNSHIFSSYQGIPECMQQWNPLLCHCCGVVLPMWIYWNWKLIRL